MIKILPSLVTLTSGLFILSVTQIAFAQVIPDGTLPTNVTSPNNLNFMVDGGARSGNNLFHSFSQFSVPSNGSVVFNNTNDIQSIFSRVTGGNISNIDGMIQANGGANLFLLNPSGILFGSNASLNIGGSFIATTANSIKFNDGVLFSAVDVTKNPLLTVNVPIGLQMGNNPAAIQVQGNGHQIQFKYLSPLSIVPDQSQRPVGLQVRDGQTLALVGGALNLKGGNLTANSARIELGSVAESGTVGIQPTSDGLTFSYKTIRQFDNIALTQAASIEASGVGSGNIQIQGKNIDILDNSTILANTLGRSNGRITKINASESLNIIASDGDWRSSIYSQAGVDAISNGGNIIINAPQILVQDGAIIATETLGRANAGSITIEANNMTVKGHYPSSELLQSLVSTNVRNEGSGMGGNLDIKTDQLTLLNGGQLNAATFGSGNAGNLTIQAKRTDISGATKNETLVAGLNTSSGTRVGVPSQGQAQLLWVHGPGKGGNMLLETDILRVSDGGMILALTNGEGEGGTVTIRAGLAELIGVTPVYGFSTRLETVARNRGTASGGNILIEADVFRVVDGARVRAESEGPGNAGSITIKANRVDITGISTPSSRTLSNIPSEHSRLVSATTGSTKTGNGGDIRIEASSVNITNGGVITTFTRGGGNAGSISIKASSMFIQGSEEIKNSGIIGSGLAIPAGFGRTGLLAGVDFTGATGQGGNIDVNVGRLILSDTGKIESSTSGTGNAGFIRVNADILQLSNGAEISAATTSSGKAGDINLTVQRATLNNNAQITTSSTGIGDGGTINLGGEQLSLGNRSVINAATASGNGGNLNLTLSEFLSLRDQSQLNAEARGTGNGGNMNLDAVLMVGNGNSDIIANAVDGRGGNIEITTQGILGLQYRERPSLENDITASSKFGVNGTVQINNVGGFDPNSGLVELPVNIADSSQQIANSCVTNQDSSFVITGRGGLPENPNQQIRINPTWSDIRNTTPYQKNHPVTPEIPAQNETLIQATGLRRNAKGEMELVADETSTPMHQSLNCALRQNNFPTNN